MRIIETLLKIKFLCSIRASPLSRLLRGQIIGFKKSIFLIGIVFGLFLIAFVIAVFLWPGYFSSPLMRWLFLKIVENRTGLLKVLWLLFFYYGILLGWDLVFELKLNDNLSFLNLPILFSDLVILRIVESIFGSVKLFAVIFLPLFFLVYSKQGIPILLILVFLVLLQFVCLSSSLVGITFLLVLKTKLMKTGSEIILRFIVVITAGGFALWKILYKQFPESGVLLQVQSFINSILDFLSFRDTVTITFIPDSISLSKSILAVFVLAPFVVSLIFLFYHALLYLYRNMHLFSVEGQNIQKRRITWRLDRVYGLLRKIPMDLRIVIARDTIAFLRRPNLLLKVLFFVLILGAYFYQLKSSIIFIPKTLILYILPSYVLLRFFIHSIGLERNNIFLIKQLSPSMAVYFMNRVKVAALVSFLFISPLWIVSFLFATQISFIHIVYRSILLISSLIASVFLLTGFSATFAVFDEDRVEHNSFGIPSGALLVYLILGFSIPMFFYLIDIWIIGQVRYDNLSIIASISGLMSIFSVLAFCFLGIRRLEKYL